MNAKRATIVLMCGAAVMAGCAQQEEAPVNQADPAANHVESGSLDTVTAEAETLPCTHVGTDAAYRQWQEAQPSAKAGSVPTARNDLVVEGGDSYRWNDAPIDATILRQYLDIVHTMSPEPWVVVRRGTGADEASLIKARGIIFLSLNCRAAI